MSVNYFTDRETSLKYAKGKIGHHVGRMNSRMHVKQAKK